MRNWGILLYLVGLFLLVGCNSNEETISVNSSGKATYDSSDSSIEKTSEKDLTTAFLYYMGKDELGDLRGRYAVGDGEEGKLKEGKIIPADEFAAGWGELPYEDILQSIELYLKQEGFETVSAQLVAEYLDDQYRIEGFSQNIYDTILYIASRLNENNELRSVSVDEWQMLNHIQKKALATNLLNQTSNYSEFLSRYDMKDVPSELLVELVDDYVYVYNPSYHYDVMHFMGNALSDILSVDDKIQTILSHLAQGFNTNDMYILDSIYSKVSKYSNGFNEEFLQYQSFNMDFDYVETIKISPFSETYYGVVDMTYSYTTNKEKLSQYEEENNTPYPTDRLFNEGKDINNKKVRTLVVVKRNIDTEFGLDVRSLYEIDKNSKYASEFIEN